MDFPTLTITTDPDDGKSRSFTVHRLAHLLPEVAEPSATPVRPWLLVAAASPSAVDAFSANLRRGEVAEMDSTRSYKLPTTLDYRFRVTAPRPGSAVLWAYLPSVVHRHPGAAGDDTTLRFVSAPPRWWLDRQADLLEPDFGPDARDYARAMSFVARLDTRTPLPIANDPAFHLALYRRAVAESPGNADAWRGLGMVSERMGQTQRARSAYQRYLTLAPNAPDAARVRAQLESLGDG